MPHDLPTSTSPGEERSDVTTAFDTPALVQQMERVGIVPVLVIERAADVLPVAEALVRGGCAVIEITLRTGAALDAIAALAAQRTVVVGAGTVLNARQAGDARAAGADFLVAPGFDERTVEYARSASVPIVPGIATATELMQAWNHGLRFVKVFPASTLGGAVAIRSFASIAGDMRFMPTGGIAVDDLGDYLAIPSVVACGGTWLAPAASISAGDFAGIARRTTIATTIARRARGGGGRITDRDPGTVPTARDPGP
jgi:2-dehydro-3-deoxyphosphogluconate aldolase/(4S)-4-hydroxy-2-oxoglutarate aldolase